jgi:hypothetical protein
MGRDGTERRRTAGSAPFFELDSQRADMISNVAGSQYNLQAVRLLEPMRRRAHLVLRVGLALILLGFVAGAIGEVMWRSVVTRCFSIDAQFGCGRNTVGLAIAQIGGIMLGLGLIVVVVSLFMRRQVRKRKAEL